MTKEELEEEAKDYANKKVPKTEMPNMWNRFFKSYLAGAEPREKRIEELKKENAELDCQKNRNKFCYSCVNATERCFRNEIGCPCEKYKSYKDENAELKQINSEGLTQLNLENGKLIIENENLRKENEELRLKLEALEGQTPWKDIKDKSELIKENAELQKEIRCECTRCVYSDSPCIRSDYGVENDEDVCPNYENVFVAYTQLKEENAELKEKYVQNICDCDICDSYCNSQLIKAKEIIRDFLSVVIDYIDKEDKNYSFIAEAKQFLYSEVEE